jgi:hypothetical protein
MAIADPVASKVYERAAPRLLHAGSMNATPLTEYRSARGDCWSAIQQPIGAAGSEAELVLGAFAHRRARWPSAVPTLHHFGDDSMRHGRSRAHAIKNNRPHRNAVVVGLTSRAARTPLASTWNVAHCALQRVLGAIDE